MKVMDAMEVLETSFYLEISPFTHNTIWRQDYLGTRMLGQLRLLLLFKWLGFFQFSFQSTAAPFELDHQAAAPDLLKTCFMDLKFFRLNLGNGGRITFTNDIKDTESLRIMSLDMEVILNKSSFCTRLKLWILVLHSDLWKTSLQHIW